MINDIALPLTPFGEKITNSDVVLICIDRIASQCAKLKGRCVKRSEDGIITERNKNLSFLLKSKSNEYMTPYQFIYRVVSLLLLNDNSFFYPPYDKDTLELKTLYPLNQIIVEAIVNKSETYYLKFFLKVVSHLFLLIIVFIKGFRLSSKGFVLLVGVSFCIKVIAQRHIERTTLIQFVRVFFM